MCCFNKLFLFVLNFFVFGIGVAVVALASTVIHKSALFTELTTENFVLAIPIWTLVVGLFIALVGFFGCCGALKENRCMLYSYATIVLVLLMAEFALGILILAKPEEAKEQIKNGLTSAFKRYDEDNKETLRASIDLMQKELHCCGVNNYTDWFDELRNGTSSNDVTIGCCREQTENCFKNIKGKTEVEIDDLIYTHGCFNEFIEGIKGETIGLGVAAIILALIQFACISIACGLGRQSGKRSEYS